MNWIFRTLIIDAAQRDLAATLCYTLAGESGANMFTTELSPTGEKPATHFISTGLITEEFAQLIPWDEYTVDADGLPIVIPHPGMPELIVQLAAQKELIVTLEDVLGVFAGLDSSDQDPFVAEERLGLKMVQEAML